MKLMYFDNYKLGVVKGDGVVDVSSVVEGIPHTGPHDLKYGFDVLLFATTREEQRRSREENFQPHQYSLPKARSKSAFAFQKLARAL